MLRTIKQFACVLALGCTLSCGSGSGGNESNTFQKEGDLSDSSATSDTNGVASTSVTIPPGTNKLAIVSSTDAFIATATAANDLGTVYVSAAGEVTTASTFLDTFVSAINIPSRDFDPPLAGSTINVQSVVAGSYDGGALSGRTVNFSSLARSDADLASGNLQVNVNYIGATANDPDLRAAMEQSIEVFKQIYGSAGITLVVNEFDFSGPNIIPDPSTGDALYGALSNAVPSPAVNVCLGLDLTTPDLLGLAAGIPGSPLPSVKSCVGVSAINAAGYDGVFSPDDIRVLGETLAHEVGHFMGLFHPVEGDFATFDPLTDTPTCGGESSCDSALGANNMYYVPVGNTPQFNLTPQQRGVLNLYAAVD